ncbi:hypothetical protein ACFFRR_010906 [Megaselia abdita]
MSEITYRVAIPSDKQRIGKFLLEHFWPDEPTFKAAGVLPSDEENEDCLRCIDYGTCTIAEDQNGIIAGVRLAKVRVPSDIEKAADKPWSQFDQIFEFLRIIAVNAKVFERYNVDKLLQSMLICVSRDFRGKGIGLKLYSENMELGKKLGYKVYVCDCTSAFSAKLCEKLGMECIAAWDYSEYLDEDGKQLFTPDSVHDKLRVYGKAL